MDVLDAIFTRRSIRKYSGEPVLVEDIDAILKAGLHAPSAHNKQPWDFIIVKDKNKFERIAKVHTYAKMLPHSEVCVIVCGDKNKQPMTGFLIEDCSAAIENMLLAANGLGLGAVWCGLYPVTHLTKGMIEIFELPEYIIPVGMVVIGQKGEERKMENRFDPTKLHYEKW